jgi:ribose transport system ATP-binding protein
LKGHGRLVIDNLEVSPGAIVGVAGLVGAGVEKLFAVLFGLAKPISGRIILPSGVPLPSDTAEAVKAGIAYGPADRKQHGLMLRQSIAENVVSVRALTLGRDGFVLRRERLTNAAIERCRQLGVVAESVLQLVGTSSGGNQQKIVIAKWIEASPSLLVLDDPTRGIDVSAKRENAQNHATPCLVGEGGSLFLERSRRNGSSRGPRHSLRRRHAHAGTLW